MSTDMLPIVKNSESPVPQVLFKKGFDLAPKIFLLILASGVTLIGTIGLTLWMQNQARLRLDEISAMAKTSETAESLGRSFDQCAEAADALVITNDAAYRKALADLRVQTSSLSAAVLEAARGNVELEPNAEALGTKVEQHLRELMALVSDARFMDAPASARVEAHHAQSKARFEVRSAIIGYREALSLNRQAMAQKAQTLTRAVGWAIVASSLIALLILGATIWTFWFRWSRRLDRLMTNVSRLSRSDSGRKALDGSDELARLDRAIDEMLSALLIMREWERAILTNMPVGLFSMKANGQLSWVSRRFAADLEYDRNSLEGHSIFILASRQDEGRLREFVETLSRGGRMADWEVHLVTRSGKPTVTRLSGTAPQGLDMVCVAQNVAERQAAQATTAHLTQITEQMPDPVMEFTEEFEVIYMNQTARDRFPDISRDGSKHPAFQGTSALLKLLRDGEAPTVSRQFAHLGRSYEQRLVHIPSHRAFRTYCHDVSAIQKAMEDVRLSHEALVRSDAAKADTIIRVSSDLTVPAKSLIGFLGLLREDPALTSSQSAVKSLERMTTHVMQIQALAKNIEELQRIDKGEISIVSENINVRWILLDVVAQVAQQSTPRSVRFQGIDSGPDVYVWADRPQLHQALAELFGTLARYSRVGGNVVLNWVSTEGMVRLAISAVGTTVPSGGNDGPGRSATGAESLGVGFSVARRITERMSGRLSVTSQTGTTLTLTLELPLGTRTGTMEAVPLESKSDAFGPAPAYTVLYIEDSPVAVELAQDFLAARPDIHLEAAFRGDEGISKARRIRPHLIVLDMSLPDMSGLDVLSVLKADATTRDIPVVALTAGSAAVDREKGIAAGLSRFLTKPVSTITFLEAVAAFVPPR